MNEIIKRQRETYGESFRKHGASPQSTFQNNITTQHERYKQLISKLLEFKAKNFSICDIGSGLCELHSYLNNSGIVHSYTGIEIVEGMVEQSKTDFPNIRVLNLDLLSDSFDEKFDFLVLSGTFNIHGDISYKDWQEFVFAVLEKMYASAEIGIAFNALTSYTSFRNKDLFYLDPKIVSDYLIQNVSRFVSVDMLSPLYEVTYTVIRPEAMASRYDDEDFKKYF